MLAALCSSHEPKSMASMQKMLLLHVDEWLQKRLHELRDRHSTDK